MYLVLNQICPSEVLAKKVHLPLALLYWMTGLGGWWLFGFGLAKSDDDDIVYYPPSMKMLFIIKLFPISLSLSSLCATPTCPLLYYYVSPCCYAAPSSKEHPDHHRSAIYPFDCLLSSSSSCKVFHITGFSVIIMFFIPTHPHGGDYDFPPSIHRHQHHPWLAG